MLKRGYFRIHCDRDMYCIVSQIGGNYKGQVQLNTLISTAAKGEKAII